MKLLSVFTAMTLLAVGASAFSVNPGTDSTVDFPEPELAQPGVIRAAIFSDRTTGFDEGLPVLSAAVAEMQEVAPDFALTVGDMVNGYTRHAEDWLDEFENEWSVLVEPLGVPIYPAAGNHDTRPGTAGPGVDHSNEELYKDHFGPLYYSFDVENTHFVMLYSDDSLPEGRGQTYGIKEDQFNWLREDLESTDAEHIFVFLHRPLWNNRNTNWDDVHALFTANGNVRAVIAGHNHSYEKFPERDGIEYYVLGVTGGSGTGQMFDGGFDHWCLLTVDGDEWNFEIKVVGDEWVPNDIVLHEDSDAMGAVFWGRTNRTGPTAPLPKIESSGLYPTDVTLIIENPLEQECEITYELDPERQADDPEDYLISVDDRGRPHWDLLLRGHNVDLWEMDPPQGSVTLAPGASTEVTVSMSHPGAEYSLAIEPQINFTYHFIDSRGREVPLTLHRRFELTRVKRVLAQPHSHRVVDARNTLLEGWQGAWDIGLPTWTTASWETRELPGWIRIGWRGDNILWFLARFPDDRIEDYPENEANWTLSDAILLHHLNASGEQESIAIFPHREERYALRVLRNTPEREWPEIEGVDVAARDHIAIEGMRIWEFSLPAQVWLGEDWYQTHRVNIERNDNDGRYFNARRTWGLLSNRDNWPVLEFGPQGTPDPAPGVSP